jgi:hypothetical protein
MDHDQLKFLSICYLNFSTALESLIGVWPGVSTKGLETSLIGAPPSALIMWPCKRKLDEAKLKLDVRNTFAGSHHSPTVCAPAISTRQKWWWIVLEIKVSCSQWDSPACTHDGPCFFLLGAGRGEFFCLSSMFPMCSQHFFIMFPWGSSSSQIVPKDIPNSTSILTHMVCPKFNSHI